MLLRLAYKNKFSHQPYIINAKYLKKSAKHKTPNYF